MGDVHQLPRPVPGGSSAFAAAMMDIQEPPTVEVSAPEEHHKGRRGSQQGHSHEEGKEIHGLHHCYRVENGKIIPSLHCKHDHHKLSGGHLEEMSAAASHEPRRRLSICAMNLTGDDGRPRSSSDASMKRRDTVPANLVADPEFPAGSRNRSRRGSNVAAQDLHFVYDQMCGKK